MEGDRIGLKERGRTIEREGDRVRDVGVPLIRWIMSGFLLRCERGWWFFEHSGAITQPWLTAKGLELPWFHGSGNNSLFLGLACRNQAEKKLHIYKVDPCDRTRLSAQFHFELVFKIAFHYHYYNGYIDIIYAKQLGHDCLIIAQKCLQVRVEVVYNV